MKSSHKKRLYWDRTQKRDIKPGSNYGSQLSGIEGGPNDEVDHGAGFHTTLSEVATNVHDNNEYLSQRIPGIVNELPRVFFRPAKQINQQIASEMVDSINDEMFKRNVIYDVLKSVSDKVGQQLSRGFKSGLELSSSRVMYRLCRAWSSRG